MPGTNAGTGYPLTFRCAKCKRGNWRDHTRGLNYTIIARRRHNKRGLLMRCDREYEYRYRCLDCGHEGWTKHDNATRAWNNLPT